MDIDQLVAQFKAKDILAFEELYNMYHESIYGVILNIVKKQDVAEEVLQDVFLKIWHKSETYSSQKGRFFTWILNIARNAAIDTIRSKGYKTEKQNLSTDSFVNSIETYDSLDKTTNAIGIQKFVKQLSDTCKALIELLYFKGYTQSETAETLNIPLGTVKTRNRNCIKALRAIVVP
jgi:RNA polymerase sigma-70 factor (ECF subfamily)